MHPPIQLCYESHDGGTGGHLTALPDTAAHSAAQHAHKGLTRVAQHTALHGTAQCRTVQYYAVQCRTLLCNMAHYHCSLTCVCGAPQAPPSPSVLTPSCLMRVQSPACCTWRQGSGWSRWVAWLMGAFSLALPGRTCRHCPVVVRHWVLGVCCINADAI